MGNERISAAVADAGPLIHLAEIGDLALLRIFDAIHIPDAVWIETAGQNRISQESLLGLGNIHRHSLSQADVTQFIIDNQLESLHGGELECLYLCQQLDARLLLTDDLAVRNAARNSNVTPVGSLGIVVRAYRQGRLSLVEAEEYIASLYDVSSLFVTRAIVEMAIEQLRACTNQE